MWRLAAMVSQSKVWPSRTVRILVDGVRALAPLLISLVFISELFSYLNPSIQAAHGITSPAPERLLSEVVDMASNESTMSASMNSVFRAEDSLRLHCNGKTDWQRSYASWIKSGASDVKVLCAAHRRAMEPLAPGTPRLAFLFLTVRDVPLEPLWREFFRGHEDKYSLYVHASNRTGDFPAESLFHKRTIPSKVVDRFRISFVDAVRRLLAFALLDAETPNAWFTVVCDSSLPVRDFPFVYHYITRSNVSFVESFASNDWHRRGGFKDKRRGLPDKVIRKGEPWITVHRRHAGLVVGDDVVYPRFREFWKSIGIHSEHYLATLFALADQAGIGNRSLMFVNWLNRESTGGHPFGFTGDNFAPAMLEFVQRQRVNTHGFYSRSVIPRFKNQKSCVYNGVPRSPCYLFARKFSHAPQDLEVFRRVLSPSLVADER